MREIKFRGKSNNGNWIYGYPIIVSYKAWIKDVSDKTTNPRRLGRDFADFRCVEVEKETIGQYTGLKDKNGVEIYEGDILLEKNSVIWEEYTEDDGSKWSRMTNKTEDRLYQVFYDEKTCQFTTANGWLWTLNNLTEVIGNIYENSELLEVE